MERLSREFEKAEIDEDKVIRKLQRMEQSVFKDIEKDIFALFGRYATENNLTYEEAIRLLTSDEYRDFKMDVGSYIKTINNESVDEKAREKLELEYNTLAMKTRISRLEELTYRVNKNLDTLFFVTHRAVKELLEKSVTKSYNSAHTLKRDPSLRDKKLYKILEQPWSGANYSANIWNNRDKLAGIAQNEITKGIYQGKSAKKISKNISDRLDASMKDIERVVRTESKHARNEASAQAYIDMGYEWYMFSSHTEGKSSERTCERCRKINEEKYRFDKRVVGENFPPLHPNCRCTIIPIVKDEMIENSMEEEYTEIEIDLDDEKEYRSTVIDENYSGNIVKNGEIIITAKKLKNSTIDAYKDIYAEEIKPKYMHDYINNFKEAAKKLKIDEDEIPPIYFCGNETFKKGENIIGEKVAYASYNPRLNILKVNTKANYMFFERKNLSKLEEKIRINKKRLQEISSIQSERELTNAEKEEREKILSEKIMSYEDIPKEKRMAKLKTIAQKMAKKELEWTCIHEMVHYADAKLYREKNKIGKQMTKEEADGWTNWSRKKAIDFFKRENIGYEDIKDISYYALISFEKGNYEEVYAEYIAKKIMGE